jgi:hypothetical protein
MNNWEHLGSTGIQALSAYLAVDNQNTPYLAYKDMHTSFYLMKLKTLIEGRVTTYEWETIATETYPGSGKSYTLGLAIGASGTPYLLNINSNMEPNVLKYVSGSLQNVGSNLPHSSSSDFKRYYIAVYGNDVPYISYLNTNGNIIVMKYTNNMWESVGGNISSGSPVIMGMAVDGNGIPYIMYEKNNGTGLTVVAYKSGTWKTEGILQSINLPASVPIWGQRIATFNNLPYIIGPANQLGENELLNYVTGNSWNIESPTGFLTPQQTLILGSSIALDTYGVPYIAFVNSQGIPEVLKLVGGVNGSWVQWGNIPANPSLYPGYLSVVMWNNKPCVVYVDVNGNANSNITVMMSDI